MAPYTGPCVDWILSRYQAEIVRRGNEYRLAVRYRNALNLVVWDGAGSHRAGNLKVPGNVRLVRLPAYSPELNPAEHVWDDGREKFFANRIFENMAAVKQRIGEMVSHYTANPAIIRSMTAFSWI